MTFAFAEPSNDKAVLEEGAAFSPKFDAHGLITAVVADAGDGAILMLAHMNAEALALTLETGIAHFWSRSRRSIWKKGESSGNLQTVKEILTDCDQDAILLRVEVAGHAATCHTGRRSCFYRAVQVKNGAPQLTTIDEHRHFDPSQVYKK
jgi:phosphoribosyl-AMP cyclohydrolase